MRMMMMEEEEELIDEEVKVGLNYEWQKITRKGLNCDQEDKRRVTKR